MRSLWSNLFTIAIIAGLGLVMALQFLQDRFEAPGPLTEQALVKVDAPTLGQIARNLESEGVIESAWMFSWFAARRGVDTNIKAGEYEIEPGASMARVLDIVTEGRSKQYRVTVPEGYTSYQVVELLKTYDFLTGEVTDIPPEGSLAPNTYNVDRETDRQSLIDRMAAEQKAILAEYWATRAPDLPIDTPEEALILASIVEKETGVASERAQVASVFVNRLRAPMRLQSDPTIIYGITNGEHPLEGHPLGRGIRRSEIDARTDYNTYQIDGLPPTPIANPGKASIAAVMNPATTNYKYFVAVCGGRTHDFSVTYDEHRAKVARLRSCGG